MKLQIRYLITFKISSTLDVSIVIAAHSLNPSNAEATLVQSTDFRKPS